MHVALGLYHRGNGDWKILPGVTTTIWLAIKEGSKSAYGIGMGENFASFFTGKFLHGLALVLELELLAGRGYVGAEF